MTPLQRSLLVMEGNIAAGRLSRTAALARAHAEFGLSETRYYQQLLATLNDPDALAAHPAVVRRLQRLQEHARAVRGTPDPPSASGSTR